MNCATRVDALRCTVLICDDQKELREAIGKVLGGMPRYEVVAQAADGASCLDLVEQTRPDVLILDVNMPGGGPRVPRAVKSAYPDTWILVFSGRKDPELQQEMLDAGADEYLVKTGRIRPLLEALDRVTLRLGIVAP